MDLYEDAEMLDLQYEFDAPKFFDFDTLRSEPSDASHEYYDDMDESDEFSHANESWFEMEHPLHSQGHRQALRTLSSSACNPIVPKPQNFSQMSATPAQKVGREPNKRSVAVKRARANSREIGQQIGCNSEFTQASHGVADESLDNQGTPSREKKLPRVHQSSPFQSTNVTVPQPQKNVLTGAQLLGELGSLIASKVAARDTSCEVTAAKEACGAGETSPAQILAEPSPSIPLAVLQSPQKFSDFLNQNPAEGKTTRFIRKASRAQTRLKFSSAQIGSPLGLCADVFT